MASRKLLVTKPLLLFLFSFSVYFFSWLAVYKTGINDMLIQSEDTLPAFFLPASLVLEGDFDLDEYFDLLVSRYPQPDGGKVPYYLKEVDGHFYSFFPIITPLLAVPVYFLPLRLGLPVNFETIGLLGHISAALIVAASVVVMYLVFVEFFFKSHSGAERSRAIESLRGNKQETLSPRRTSGLQSDIPLVLSLVYAFGTCSFALSSQAMWQHGTSQLMFALALYFLVRGLEEPKRVVWAGLFLSLATLSRPTGAVVVVILSVYVLLRYVSCRRDALQCVSTMRYFLYYVLSGLIPLAVFLTVSGMSRGVLTGYIPHGGSGWTAPFPGAWLGLWLSPSKGVLTYSPIFFFSFLSIWILMRGRLSLIFNFQFSNPNQIPIHQFSNGSALRQSSGQAGSPQAVRKLNHCKFIENWYLKIGNFCRRLGRLTSLRYSEGALATEESQEILRYAQNDGGGGGLFYWVFICVITHSLVVGKWYSWYGGWSFGYRMMTDMLPFLAFLWVPFVRSPYWEKFKKWFYAAAVWSLGVQLAGIAFYDGVWHNLYDGGSDLDWLFSIRNCEMVYYVRRIIGKLTGIPANTIR